MWWKLGLLAVATTVVLIILVIPMATLTIRVDLPPGPGTPVPSARQIQAGAQTVVWLSEAAITGAVLVIAGFIGWRIVRHHRNSN
jgi:hypothetical protein